MFLKRPATDNYWRLDEILKRKAVMTPVPLSFLVSRIKSSGQQFHLSSVLIIVPL